MGRIKALVLKGLVRIGLTRKELDGTYRVPFHIAPKWVWKDWRTIRAHMKLHGSFYLFRNLPGVIKWVPGRMLPRRWGFGVYGLFEFGDRG